MRSSVRSALAVVLAVGLSGCLGTIVEAPTREGQSYGNTRPHFVGSSTEISAANCPNGLKQVATFVPLWGVAVGVLTLGIVVPMTTVYTCSR